MFAELHVHQHKVLPTSAQSTSSMAAAAARPPVLAASQSSPPARPQTPRCPQKPGKTASGSGLQARKGGQGREGATGLLVVARLAEEHAALLAQGMPSPSLPGSCNRHTGIPLCSLVPASDAVATAVPNAMSAVDSSVSLDMASSRTARPTASVTSGVAAFNMLMKATAACVGMGRWTRCRVQTI